MLKIQPKPPACPPYPRFIERLPDQTEREILKLCYLSCLRTETAADILGYSARQAYRIKQRALMHLEGMRY